MRPGQQNKRGRGRGNNNNGGGGGNNNNNNGFNRKGGNPLTRTYDSSGPDVKIRGTAQHIAEKYAALARDAQSSGDRVMAENYLQHAEHYNRIIASAQAQMQERFQRDERSDYNERDADDIDGVENEDGAVVAVAPQQPQPQPQPQQPRQPSQPRQQSQPRPAPAPVAAPAPEPVVIDGTGPQPVIEGTPVEVAAEEAEQAAEAPARAPARRRATGARPRRPRRTAAGAEGGDGEASGGEEPAEQPTLAEAPGE